MKPTNIVMFNMSGYSEWLRGVSNRNYHVMTELLQSDRVGKILAVDYPPLTKKRALRNYKENLLMSLPTGKVVVRTFYDKLTKISDKLSVYSNSEFFARPEHFVKRVRTMAESLHMNDFIVWSYFPPVMPYIQSLGQKLTVFDAVDNWAEHASYQAIKQQLKENYQYIKTNADIIFTVAEELQKLFDSQPNVYWIPNGADLARYQKQHVVINRDIADVPRPIVGYIGVIQDRVDLDLLVFLAKKNPTKSFVVIGPILKPRLKKVFNPRYEHPAEKKLRECPNIYYLGYKPYDEVPAYIQQFDVALIPHRASSFVTSTNPMKMYEYLACGKPVVATKGAGAEMFKENVYIAEDYEDFNRKLYRALEEDSDERRQARRRTVEDFSWNATVKQMLGIIEKKLNY